MMGNTAILIVEDVRIVAEDIKISLEKLNYTVAGIAFSGDEAIAKTIETKPDLILMDIMIKGDMDGIETAQKIEKISSIPIIYLTAYADNEMIRRAKITKPYGYIIKPFEDRELYTIIEIALYKHAMEKKIKESEEKLHTTLMSIGDGVIATDEKSIITLINKSAEKITGWAENECVGKPLSHIFTIVNKKTRKPIQNPVDRVITTGKITGLANDTILITKDGNEKIIADSGAPIKDKQNKTIGVILVFRDMTTERFLENEIQMNHKLKSIGLLAGGIAHDFNNYLNAILLNISNARMTNNIDEISQTLSVLEKIVEEARKVTSQLLIFSKGGEPIKKPALLPDIIKKSISIILIGSNVKCDFCEPENVWPVIVDSDQILQVINNVLLNAIQSMPKGGIITITLENTTIPQGDKRSINEGYYNKISIIDQGTGISPENMQKIYDPFFTTKNQGSGLGLSISHTIVKKHNGYIHAHSIPQKGSTFDIYLPAVPSIIIKDTPGKKEEPMLSGNEKILIMDDNEMVSQGLALGLNRMGYEVVISKEGSETITIYKQAMKDNKPFSLVILDLTIAGGLGGKDTMALLKKFDPDIKAIVSSGYSHDPILSQFSEYGFSDKLVKPYGIKDICLKIRSLCDNQ
ncbi:MAG: response regulator [Spirochaetales bacterium]|nr:response regulator [Spirochaetales bacterium]